MAAVVETAGTRRDSVAGQMRIVKVDVTSVDNSDTWVPGLANIDIFIYTPSAAAATTQWGATWTTPASRQAVVTLLVESGSLAGTFIAMGT